MNEQVASISFVDNGDEIAFGVPFTKVNVKDRTVEGFATLDNVDKAFDVVDSKASEEAFSAWMGNIREMHGPKAVGTAVSVEKKALNYNGQDYTGIWVKSRISKGAEDTWQKILDGTLKGYSIGGKVLERRPDVVKSDGGNYSESRVSRILKYILAELSVVDNPMNPLAMMGMSKGFLIKMEGDELVAGEAAAVTQGLFYCDNGCEIAKMDATDKIQVPCVTCDGNMVRIGEVSEVPTTTELRKMLGGFKKDDVVVEKVDNMEKENDGEAGFGVPAAGTVPEMETPNQDLLKPANLETGIQSDSPAPHAEKSESAGPQVSTGVLEGIDVSVLGTAVLNAINSGEFPGRSRVDKSTEAEDYISALLYVDMYRAVTNAHKTPPKGYPADSAKYGDPANKKYPLDTPARVRSAMAYFNAPAQRTAGGYSMTEWAGIGRRIASAANSSFGPGHTYANGRVQGPGMSKADAERGEFIINLQKNATDDNNNIVNLLHSLVGNVSETDPSIIKGGDTTTLDTTKELIEKVLDILETASREVGDVAKGFNVENLNSENASGPTVGGEADDAGVGTAEDGDSDSFSTSEVEVAKPAALATPDNGPEKVVPNAISTDGTGVGQGITSDSGPEKVLPHADLASTSSTTKAEEAEETKETSTEDLIKTVLTKVEQGFTALDGRLTAVEESGGGKKSVEIGDEKIEKSDNTPSFWGGMLSADELIEKN